MEQSTDRRIEVRKVTDVHANWSEQGVSEPGKFSFQLILDNGAVEHIVRPTAEDADVLMDLLDATDTLYFDLARGVLIFNDTAGLTPRPRHAGAVGAETDGRIRERKH